MDDVHAPPRRSDAVSHLTIGLARCDRELRWLQQDVLILTVLFVSMVVLGAWATQAGSDVWLAFASGGVIAGLRSGVGMVRRHRALSRRIRSLLEGSELGP